MGSCDDKAPQKKPGRSDLADIDGNEKREEEIEEEESGPSYINIREVKVEVTSFEVKSTEVSDIYSVPVIAMNSEKADFVKILRCGASYQFKTQSGKDIRNLRMSPASMGELEWAWTKALNDRESCTLAHEHSPAKNGKFPHIAAKSGEFYYIINPCIIADNSYKEKEECSYMFAITKAIDYESQFQEQVLVAAREVSQATSQLYGIFDRVNFLNHKLTRAIRSCETYYRFMQTKRRLQKGVLEIALYVGVLVFGIAMGGPVMGLMAAQMLGTQLPEMLLPIWWEEMRDMVQQCEGDRHYVEGFRQGKGDEGIYGIKKELEEISSRRLPAAKAAVEAAYAKMQALDDKVNTFDSFSAKMKQKGLDASKPADQQAQSPEALQGLLQGLLGGGG